MNPNKRLEIVVDIALTVTTSDGKPFMTVEPTKLRYHDAPIDVLNELQTEGAALVQRLAGQSQAVIEKVRQAGA